MGMVILVVVVVAALAALLVVAGRRQRHAGRGTIDQAHQRIFRGDPGGPGGDDVSGT